MKRLFSHPWELLQDCKISPLKQKHPPSMASAELACELQLWLSVQQRRRRKKRWKAKCVWGTLQSTKPWLVTPEGNVLLQYQLWDKTKSLKNLHHRQTLFRKKRPQFWTSKSTLSVLKSCMIYRILFKSFRVDHLSNVSKHTVSGKAENLQHIRAQGKHGVTPTIFTFFLWVHKIIASLTWIEQGNSNN